MISQTASSEHARSNCEHLEPSRHRHNRSGCLRDPQRQRVFKPRCSEIRRKFNPRGKECEGEDVSESETNDLTHITPPVPLCPTFPSLPTGFAPKASKVRDPHTMAFKTNRLGANSRARTSSSSQTSASHPGYFTPGYAHSTLRKVHT